MPVPVFPFFQRDHLLQIPEKKGVQEKKYDRVEAVVHPVENIF